jgi:1-acyl-sn-glycerol-3-phosphate acyltransferase
MNKVINSRCICKKGLPWVKLEVIMLEPCEHLIHEKCFKKLKTKNCPFCDINIEKIIKKNDYKTDSTLDQKCADIMAMTCEYDKTPFDLANFILGMPNIIGLIARLPFYKGMQNAKQLCEDLLSSHNVKIKVKGLKKIKDEKKVFIANHSTHFDYLVLFHIFGSGFLSSAFINENIIAKQVKNVIPMLVIERGKKANTVDKIREYIEENGAICMFPEGIITNPNSIVKFRTGAFHTGYPVYPIVLKYETNIFNSSTTKFILKMIPAQNLKITVYVLDPVYPPFDDKKIENIRINMARKGRMILSRVSNRDIVDPS